MVNLTGSLPLPKTFFTSNGILMKVKDSLPAISILQRNFFIKADGMIALKLLKFTRKGRKGRRRFDVRVWVSDDRMTGFKMTRFSRSPGIPMLVSADCLVYCPTISVR